MTLTQAVEAGARAALTPAQLWALEILARDGEQSPSLLGQKMMDRPGVEEQRRGGSRTSPQGLGRIGGQMGARLVKAGLATMGRRVWPDGRGVEPYGYRITSAGRAALRLKIEEMGRL